MGILRNLEIMLGGIITRKVDSALFNWVEAVSNFLDNLGLGEQPASLQGGLIVDPANVTGVATDVGSGTASTNGVTGRVFNSWQALVNAWGTTAPVFSQNTVITFASANATTDPVIFYPQSRIPVTITLTAPLTLVATVALAAVVSKNRAAGANALLQADLGASAVAGSFLVNTTRGNSCAHVESLVAGTTWNISQPFAPVPVPINTGAPAEVDTWANTDSVQIFAYAFQVTIGAFIPNIMGAAINSSSGGGVIYRMKYGGINALTGVELGGATCVESNSQRAHFLSPAQDNVFPRFINHFFQVGGITNFGYTSGTIIGGIVGAGTVLTLCGRNTVIDGDVIIRGTIGLDGIVTVGFAYLGFNGECITISLGRVIFTTSNYGGHVVYGAAGSFINVRGPSRANMSGSFAAGFTAPELITGGVRLNGVATGYNTDGANPATLRGGIATTVANLDAALPGGFAGTAFNLGGSCITNGGQ